jgi:hypothetical protein
MTNDTQFAVERRTVMKAGGAIAAATLLPAGVQAAGNAATILFDPALPRAATLASAETGRQVALEGDRVRFWRARMRGVTGPIAGFTSWSDYLLLRGLAEEQGLRLRREVDFSPSVTGTLIGWLVA